MSDAPREEEPSGLRYSFRALRHRNFLLFWLSSIVSNSGTWLSNLTIPFVLYQVTGSALWVGYAAIAQYLPYVVMGPWGGALADRMSRKHVLLVTQSVMALVAIALFVAWSVGVRDPLVILVFVVANAFVNGLNMPSWQAFINDLVPREDLRSAIALNSIQVNASRAIGPAIGGLLLAAVGAAFAFLINALSFVAVIIVLFLVKVLNEVPTGKARRGGVMRDIIEAGRYAFEHPGLRMSIIVSVLFSVFGNPIYTLTVILADDVYRVDPFGLGMLNAAIGVGAIAFAPFVAGSLRGLQLSQVVRWTMIATGVGLVLLGINGLYAPALLVLAAIGAASLGIMTSSQSSLQLIVAERMRGRVISVRFLLVTGLMPVGTQWQTAVAEVFGIQTALLWAGIGMLAVTAVLLLLPARHGLARLDDPQDLR